MCIRDRNDTITTRGNLTSTSLVGCRIKIEGDLDCTKNPGALDKAKFLGYEIFIRKSDAVKRNKDGVLKRDFNGAVVLTLNSADVYKRQFFTCPQRSAKAGREIYLPFTCMRSSMHSI